MILLPKNNVKQNYVIEVKVAVFWGEHRGVWFISTSTFQGGLPSPLL